MPGRFLGLLGCCVLLGCASPAQRAAQAEQRAAEDDTACQGYGAKPGTDAYVQCRIVQQARRDQAEQERTRAAQEASRSMAEGFREAGRIMSERGKSRTSCTSTRLGDTIHTTCDD
jgi:hypothetical protein